MALTFLQGESLPKYILVIGDFTNNKEDAYETVSELSGYGNRDDP